MHKKWEQFTFLVVKIVSKLVLHLSVQKNLFYILLLFLSLATEKYFLLVRNCFDEEKSLIKHRIFC